MTIYRIEQNTEEHKGKTLSHFEDEHGNVLKNLSMLDSLSIVFADGTKIKLIQDWYGNECYFSQIREGER